MNIVAAVTNGAGGAFSIETVQMDEPWTDEILVRIKATGICHTDLSARNQYIPFPLPGVLGHEGAGIVEKTGSSVSKAKPGDHVTLSWLNCGVCDACKSGNNMYCKDFLKLNFGGVRQDGTTTMSREGKPLHGSFFGQSSFASHALVIEDNIVKVTDAVPIEIMGPLGCGVMTGAGAVMNSLKASPGSSIAVFGAGLVGVVAPGTEVNLDMNLIMNGRTIKGIIEGDAVPDLFIPKLIELKEQGRFPYDKLIKYYPFADINQAVDDMEKGLAIKPVLTQ